MNIHVESVELVRGALSLLKSSVVYVHIYGMVSDEELRSVCSEFGMKGVTVFIYSGLEC